MPLDKDYYRILQVRPSAEHETIHAAYKRLSRKYHPDMNKSPDATRQMQDINEAYAVLSDPQKRAEYDRRKRHSSLGTEAERHVRERQQKLAMLYERGIQLLSQNRWAGALAVFDELLALDPAYRDAPARRQAARRALEERQRADKLARLYREAMEHFRAERWQVAADEFKEIQRLDPGDRNIPHLLRKAEQQNRLASLYEQGLQLLGQSKWANALAVFDELVALDPTYRDAPTRRQAAQRALEGRGRANKLAQLYREAMEHFRAEQWQVAIDEFKEIQRLDPDDRYMAHLLQEAEQQNRLANLYADAEKYVQLQAWREAIVRLENILSQSPNYRDVAERLKQAQQQQWGADPAASSSSTRPTWQMGVGIIILVLALVIGFVMMKSRSAPPTLRPTVPRDMSTSVPATPSAIPYIRRLNNLPHDLSSPEATQPPRPTVTAALALSTSMPATVTSRMADKDGMIMVYVPAGEFLMGSANLSNGAR